MRWNALRSMSAAACPGPEASISKLFWGTWHRDLGELMVDLLGADGHDRRGRPADGYQLTLEQKLFLFTRADTIYGGSNEIQRNVLGERVLGLPKEPPRSTALRLHYVPGSTACSPARTVLVTAAAGTRHRVRRPPSAASRRAPPSIISDKHERRLRRDRRRARRRRHPVRRHRRSDRAGAVRRRDRARSAASTCSSTTPAWAARPSCTR